VVQLTGPGGWRLEIPAGPAGRYRLAQLDDHQGRGRGEFIWQPPLSLRLRARASAAELPGTWGFGLWNDPFSLSLGLGGGTRRFPALPNAAWFFFASPPNYLSFRDDLPAQGALAATFAARPWPAVLLALGSPALTLLLAPGLAQVLRRLARLVIHQGAAALELEATAWHSYRIDWETQAVRFYVDEALVYTTPAAPQGPLSLVLWIDNQYAALPRRGRLAYGTLANPEPAWIELENVACDTPQGSG
jgi:hypothetical protein